MKRYDGILLGAVFLLLILSLLVIASLSFNDQPPYFSFYRQLVVILLGLGLMVLFSLIDYRLWRKSSFILFVYLLLLALLILILVFGQVFGGTRGWFKLGYFYFQPVEFIKIVLILILAKYFANRHIEIWRWQHVFISAFYTFLPFVLVMLQPDLASALVLVCLWLGFMWLAEIRFHQVLVLILVLVLASLFFWQFGLKDYQKQRIITFLYPEKDVLGSGYNMRQALIAIGSAGFLGQGLGWGTQTHLKFLPAAKTDFIFASLTEEMGLAGAFLVLLCFGFIFWRLYQIGRSSDNNFSQLFVFGFMIKLLIEVVANLGMNVGLLPVAGLPLPFLSYGGSHLLSDFIALGIILNIRKNNV